MRRVRACGPGPYIPGSCETPRVSCEGVGRSPQSEPISPRRLSESATPAEGLSMPAEGRPRARGREERSVKRSVERSVERSVDVGRGSRAEMRESIIPVWRFQRSSKSEIRGWRVHMSDWVLKNTIVYHMISHA
eukprot:5973685-Prymnesium_polylepis.1